MNIYKEGDIINSCTFIREVEPYIYGNNKRHRKAIFKCRCGKEFETLISHVKRGNTKSCGCYNIEQLKRPRVHGLSYHPLYGIWQNMKNRCYRKETVDFKYYGGKGIEVCEEWKTNFKNFYDWSISNGWKKGLSIDRIRGEKSYSPENCRWVTYLIQARNRISNIIVEENGEKMCLKDYCERNSFDYITVKNRISRWSWSLERATSTPKRSERLKYEI